MSSQTVQEETASILKDARRVGLGVDMNRKLDKAIEAFEAEPPSKPPIEKLKHGAL